MGVTLLVYMSLETQLFLLALPFFLYPLYFGCCLFKKSGFSVNNNTSINKKKKLIGVNK